MKKQVWVLAGKSYKKKKSIKEACKKILHQKEEEFYITDEKEHEFLQDLLSHHYFHGERIAKNNIKSFSVAWNPNFGGHTKSFYFELENGYKSDFSYLKTISPPSHFNHVVDALRTEIYPYCRQYKEDYFSRNETPVSEMTGRAVTREDCHVDHFDPLFCDIVEAFFEIHPCETLKVRHGENGYRDLEDRDVAKEWYDFHKDKALLRVVTSEENLTRPKKKQKA